MAAGSDLCVMPSIDSEKVEPFPNVQKSDKTLLSKQQNIVEDVQQGDKLHPDENGSDSSFLVEAYYISKDGKIFVQEQKHQDQLRNKGFGEIFNKEYLLSYLEALFLLQNGKLKILGKNKEYDFSSLMKILIRKDKKLLTKYLIYRDLRSKGYVVKDGFGFGTDFRVYERGDYNKKTSKYVAIGLNEGTTISAFSFANMVEQVESMGKSAVIAVVERRGEVIYYKTSQMTFPENKKSK
ncbi:MAG TPA: tRNA-intron lyase [Candidatus Saccharimonadales bacterium]|nr:tRNA-intron lyase [Candidatus Saccharimonadales bacterium]